MSDADTPAVPVGPDLTKELIVPTYDYECGACGHTWEEFQSITEGPKRKCPECGRLKAKRLIGTGAAVLFKGSGFYQTDYRSEEYKKSAKADKESASPSSSDSKSGDKGDGKKASKKKPKDST